MNQYEVEESLQRSEALDREEGQRLLRIMFMSV